jgi:hypothetical protein
VHNFTINGTATAKQYKAVRDCVGQTDIVPALRSSSPEYNRKESSFDNNVLDYSKKTEDTEQPHSSRDIESE